MPVTGCEITWRHDGDLRTTYTLGEGGLACAGMIHWTASPDMVALFDAISRHAAEREEQRREDAERATRDFVNSLLSPDLLARGYRFEWVGEPAAPGARVVAAMNDMMVNGPGSGRQEAFDQAQNDVIRARCLEGFMDADQFRAAYLGAVPAGYDGIIGALEDVYQPGTRIVGNDEFEFGIDWGDPLEPADANTPEADAMICGHVCGADADHACDAKATDIIEHRNLAGGTTRMPACGPCGQSERAAMAAGDA